MPDPSAALPPRGSPETPPVGKLDRIRKLMLRVTASANPEGQIRDLLELCVEPSMREGDTDLRSGKEALRGSNRRNEVGVPRYDHQGVAGIEVEELDGLYPQGHIGLLLLAEFEPRSTPPTDDSLSLETGHVELEAAPLQSPQVGAMPQHRLRIAPMEVIGDGSEEVDLLQLGLPAEHTEVRSQKPLNIQPAEVIVPQGSLGLANGEVKVEPVNKEGHPVRHGPFLENKNPPGRDPRGPGEARRTARGGMKEKSTEPCLKSRGLVANGRSHGRIRRPEEGDIGRAFS